ncbi:hypothetical protein TrST_g10711 [Triparma strigata]|uniref:Uncharacterized protein n=1 Tax=Triparma strigata TaxID=1606541 RepID=A0A9W7A6P4_9STRA|nr:hypothetical protein TrST_g10711 [Triparma strigata]
MALIAAILTMGMGAHDTSMFPFFSTLRASEPPSSSTLATAYGFPEDQQCDEVNIFEKGQEAASRPPPSSTLATTYGLSEAQQATFSLPEVQQATSSLPEAQQDDEVNIFSLSEVQQDDEVKVTEKGHEDASMHPSSSTLTAAYGLPKVQQATSSLPEAQQDDEVNIFSLSEVQQDDETKVTEKGHEAASMHPSSSTLASAYGLPKVQQDNEVKVTEKGHEAASMLPTSSTLTTAYGLSEVQQGNETNVIYKGHENITSTSMALNFHSSMGSGVPVGADGEQESCRQKIHEGVLTSTKNVESDSYSWCTLLDPSEKHDLNKFNVDETDRRCSETVWALGQHVLSTPICSPHLPQNVQALPRPQSQKPDLKYTLETSVLSSLLPASKLEPNNVKSTNDAQAGCKESALTPSPRSSATSKHGGTSVGSDQIEEVGEGEAAISLPFLLCLLPLVMVVAIFGLVATVASLPSALRGFGDRKLVKLLAKLAQA